jgi:pimeloyl-ACP methyl ester carboxylesterase
MKKLAHCSMITLLVLMFIGLCFLSTPASANHEMQFPTIRPIIFIHGGGGSAAQFEAQAQRFTSNGYPENYIATYEWDTRNGLNIPDFEPIFKDIDKLIDALRQETGADKVELTGHSMGGGVTFRYLASSPERANKVAHYVTFEGAVGAVKTFDVPMMCIWGENYKTINYPGAINVINYGQTHTQSAVSAETFLAMYRFFNGVDPVTANIVAEPRGQIRLSGRALIYRQNAPVVGSTVEIYKVDGYTGFRFQKKPEEIYPIDETGNWGPFKAKGGEYYEFVIVREGENQNHHFYYEPFIRSDHFIRLITSTEPDGGSTAFMERSDHHTNLVVTKGEEFLGAQSLNDVLLIDGVNVVTPVTVPGTGAPVNMINALYIYDKGTDGISNIVISPGLIDLYIPGAYPPNATINVALQARDGGGKWQVLNVPNWASSYTRRITVQFKTYVQ